MMTMISCSEAVGINNNNPMNMVIKTQTFSSPSFTTTPGLVIEKFFYNINFPKSHIAIKSFDVEVVDESGNQVPLPQTYLHHWALVRYYQHKNATNPTIILSLTSSKNQTLSLLATMESVDGTFYRPTTPWDPNQENYPHFFHTHMELKLGIQKKFPQITKRGGVSMSMQLIQEEQRTSWDWVDWNDLVIPVKVYLFDVTDTWKPLSDSTEASQQRNCLIEYDVEAESCSHTNKVDDDKCNAVKKSKVMFPSSGYLIYGVAHQHIGATGATFYGEDGRVLCSSSPIHGKGNEEGYVVGMTTCYPQPGSMKINKGEMVTFVSNYSSTPTHRGVMGIFHIFVADKIFKSSSALSEEVGNNNTIVM
uniref:Stress up-regulated Nod 19 protein n=1 Tax=Cucumis melo TaxID=3656 RepID=A0A9I9DFQ8_CUCME